MNEPLNVENIKSTSSKFDTVINIAGKLIIAITGIAIGCVIGIIVGLSTGLIWFAC